MDECIFCEDDLTGNVEEYCHRCGAEFVCFNCLEDEWCPDCKKDHWNSLPDNIKNESIKMANG